MKTTKAVTLLSTGVLFMATLTTPSLTLADSLNQEVSTSQLGDTSSESTKSSSVQEDSTGSSESTKSSSVQKNSAISEAKETRDIMRSSASIPPSSVLVTGTTADGNSASTAVATDQLASFGFSIKNTDVNGNIIPAGTTFTIASNVDSRISSSKKPSFSNIINNSATPNLFTATSDSTTGDVTVTVSQDLYPGTYAFILNFKNSGNIDYNWDGLNSGTAVPVNVTGTSSLTDVPVTITPSTYYIQPHSKDNGFNGLPGYVGGGTAGNTFAGEGYTDNYVGLKNDTLLFNPIEVGNQYYMDFISSYSAYYTSNSKGALKISADTAFSNSALIIDPDGTGKNNIDISNTPGVTWTRSSDGKTIEVDFSQYMALNGIGTQSPATIKLTGLVPVSNINQVVTFTGGISWDSWTEAPFWEHTQKAIFQSTDPTGTTPYFRGNDLTTYNTDTLSPLSNLFAFVSGNDISSEISITDLDGYPSDGVNPNSNSDGTPKVYTITYSVPDSDNGSVSFKRTITVLQNKQSIEGSDVTIYTGDSVPSSDAFKASATDKDGNNSAVTIDTSKVDTSKAGDYDVLITSADGQTKTVTVHVLQNKQSIEGKSSDKNNISSKSSNLDKEVHQNKKSEQGKLPQTGVASQAGLTIIGMLTLLVFGVLSFLKIRKRKE